MAEPDVSSEEWRAQAVAWFLSSEKTIAEIAHTLNLSESVVREWVWNATPEPVSDDGHSGPNGADQAVPEATLAETAAINAAAVEAVLRAEIMAAEAVARAEAVAAEAKAAAADAQAQLEVVRVQLEAARAEIAVRIAAEAAAREEMRAVYAEAVEAIERAEAGAAAGVAPAGATTAEAMTEAGPVESVTQPVEAPIVAADALSRPSDRSEAEAEARAKIAEVMERARLVELWMHATGRTLEGAKAEVLGRLGVDETQAEIEVLANGSRWLPGQVHVRGRLRGRTQLRLMTKPAGPGPVASAGPGPADGRG